MKEEFTTLKFFYVFAHGLRNKFLFISFLLFFGKLSLTTAPILAGQAVDHIHHHDHLELVYSFVIGYVVLRILEPLFIYIANHQAHPLINKITRRILYWGYTKIWGSEIRALAQKDPVEIKNIWEQTRQAANSVMSIAYLQIFPIVLEFFFYFLVIGFFWNWFVGFFVLFFCIIFFSLSMALSKYNSSQYSKVLISLNEDSLSFGTSFSDFETVKTWGLEERELKKQESTLKTLEQAQSFNRIKSNLSDFILAMLINMTAIIIFLWASIELYNDKITSGFYATIMLAIGQIFTPLKNMCLSFREMNDKLKAMKNFYLLIKDLPQESLNEDKMVQNLQKEIIFENVTLGYEDGNLLEDINLNLPYGSKIAILGSSGQGKTSLARSILKLSPIIKGEIYFGEVPLNKMPLQTLRNKVIYVSQDPFLRPTTIRDNLMLDVDFPEDILIEYMNKMNLSSLVHRLDEPMAQRGFTLSIGQRTRISLLRSIVRNPDIIIIDEPVSSLDKDTAKEVLELIKNHFALQTVILIVHNTKHLKWVDKFWIVRNHTVKEILSSSYQLEQKALKAKKEEKTQELVHAIQDHADTLLENIK